MRAPGLRTAARLVLMMMMMMMLVLVLAAVRVRAADVIDDILGSLSRGVSFLERQREHINLDGAVGFVMLQAQLKAAVRAWPHSDPVSWTQRTAAVELLRRLDRSLEGAGGALQRTEPRYYREFEPLLSWTFWRVPEDWTSTDPVLQFRTSAGAECYDEPMSDQCLTLLLGTWKAGGTACIVTQTCRETMTRFGCPRYSLSHQMLYFLVGRMGCVSLLRGDSRPSRLNLTELHYEKIFCSNMLRANQDAASGGPAQHDLFIENILICGLAGFSDFHKPEWLQLILQLQDEELGCFGRDKSVMSQMIGDELLEQLQPHRRVKRREKVLPDGCSSHMTAVAVGALGGFLNSHLAEQDITKRPLP